ncbi:MAG: SDR family oxidoreductase [Bacteroidetes bacterium]|nr:SDR family oxidoreductase [Bacteroidota bacterium]
MKDYIVIGGTSGIGLEIVRSLSAAGHHVHVLSRSQRNLDGLDRVSHTVWDALGGEAPAGEWPAQIDGLVYCPGSITLKPFHRLTGEDFISDYQVNVIGAVRAIQYFLPALKAAELPSIVLFSTVAVKTGMPFHASISAAKGAIEGLTRSLAADLAPRIRVNCIAPSLVQTELSARLTSSEEKIKASAQRHPLARIGTPADIAAMATLLLTEAQWITGQVLHIDGGMSSLRL